jgi:hypothetical protein
VVGEVLAVVGAVDEGSSSAEVATGTWAWALRVKRVESELPAEMDCEGAWENRPNVPDAAGLAGT